MMLSLPSTSLRPGDRVCVAVSGGADSTALLLLVHAANTLPRNALGVGLSAMHVNHTLRGTESDADQAFVDDLCARLSIPLHVRVVGTQAHATERRETLEEAARNLRIEAFDTLLRSGQATHILTAHTLDDQAETVLMKLLRGAWLEGLSGIAPIITRPAGKIIRPLLTTRRADLRSFLALKGQAWREDASNVDQAFTRNRIRHTVLPLLRVENPSIEETLSNLAELARDEEAHWSTELGRLLPQIVLPGTPVRGGGRSNSTTPGAQALAVELDHLKRLNPAQRRRVIRAAAERLQVALSFSETSRLLALAGLPPGERQDPTVSAKAGTVLHLSHGLVAQRTLRELRLSRSSPNVDPA